MYENTLLDPNISHKHKYVRNQNLAQKKPCATYKNKGTRSSEQNNVGVIPRVTLKQRDK